MNNLSRYKKVLYISPNGYLGGAERFILTAVKEHASGNKVDASILFFSEGEAYEEAKAAGVNVYLLKQSFRFRYPWKLLLALMEIRSLIKEINPDIIHETMPYSHIVISLATFGLNIKKVWFQHGPVGGRLDKIANLFPVDIILYSCVDLKTRHKEMWPPGHVRVQESIINLGVRSVTHNHLLFRDSPLILGTAGRICSWKGYHNLLIALGELKQEINLKPFKLRIAGSAKRFQDQKYKKKLVELTQTYNLTNEVEFLDHQKNMDAIYQGIDIFIHSSTIAEPFGLVVAEAMLNGCLVIASDTGGIADMVQNGITGLTFSAGTEKAINELKKILNIFLNPKESIVVQNYQNIANQGKDFIKNKYSVEQMIEQLESLYCELTPDKDEK